MHPHSRPHRLGLSVGAGAIVSQTRSLFRLSRRPLGRLVVTQILMFALGLGLGAPSTALAGHQYGPGGDCWRAGTPWNCRIGWSDGNRTTVYIRIYDQIYDSVLWNYAVQACNAWLSAAGPQYCHTTAYLHDSFVYFKGDNTIAPPNAITWNCRTGACPAPNNTGLIEWTEIWEPIANKNYGTLNLSISGHELGHSLGLAHHGAAGSNQALMTQGTTLTAPNSIDIGPLPACSTVPIGSNGTGGTRCIYHSGG
jgi:hypothetical protein